MINMQEVLETNNMIAHEKLDVRTITMGISLLDCVDSDLAKMNEKIYNKITTYAKDLVSTGDAIGREFGVPIVNKRISDRAGRGKRLQEERGFCRDCENT